MTTVGKKVISLKPPFLTIFILQMHPERKRTSVYVQGSLACTVNRMDNLVFN